MLDQEVKFMGDLINELINYSLWHSIDVVLADQTLFSHEGQISRHNRTHIILTLKYTAHTRFLRNISLLLTHNVFLPFSPVITSIEWIENDKILK